MKTGRRQSLASIVAISVAVALITILILTKKGPEAKLEELPALKVVLVEVQRQDIVPKEILTGRLQPVRTAKLEFEVQGRVRERLVEPGTAIVTGQALLVLDDDDFRDQLAQTKSQYQIEQAGILRDQRMLKLAKQNLTLQQAEVNRFEKLKDDSLISASQLDAARQQMLTLDSQVSDLAYKVSTAKSRLDLKKSDQDTAERNLLRTTLQAPFDGYVNEVNVQVGDIISANKIVATVVDTSSLDLHLDVRGGVAAALKLGQEIDIRVGAKIIKGKLIALQPDPDSSTNTHALRIRMSGEDVQSGMLATAELLLLTQTNAMTVPVSAVATNAGENYVYVYADDGLLKKVAVLINRRVGAKYIVNANLEAGQKIVARDVAGLIDGQAVIADQ